MKSYSIIVLGIIVTIITAGAVSTGLTAPVKKSTHGSASVTPQDKDLSYVARAIYGRMRRRMNSRVPNTLYKIARLCSSRPAKTRALPSSL